MIQHHPSAPLDPPPAYTMRPPPPMIPYTMADGNPPHYYQHLLPAFTAPHMAPTSPGMLHSPMVPCAEDCSPLQILPGSHPHSQASAQAYQVSPKMAHISPVSGALPNGTYAAQPSPNPLPTSCMYQSNPGSPMQVVYSPAQPLLRGNSNSNLYMQCNGADEVIHLPHPPVSSMATTPGLLQHLPLPEYSHAMTLGGGIFPPVGVAQHDFHHMPGTDPPPNTHF